MAMVVAACLLLEYGVSAAAVAVGWSQYLNAIMVMIKIGVLILFIALGLKGWDSDNLSDFAPAGVNGVTSAAGIIFFSYIGLDAVSTAGEEVKNPRRLLHSSPVPVAVEWEEGDVLVVGSSSMGPFAQVFLGSRSTKIVQHSPAQTAESA